MAIIEVEILAALANAVVLILISFFILWEAVDRFRNPPEIATGMMLGIAVLGLIVNLIGVAFASAAARRRVSTRRRFTSRCSPDLLSSVGVIVAARVMSATGWLWPTHWCLPPSDFYSAPYMEPAHGGGWRAAGGTPADVDLESVRRAMEAVPGVARVHDLQVWTITSGKRVERTRCCATE